MTNLDMSSYDEGPLKKLRKRERRLNERLLEALAAQEKARERLRRAEARVQKRAARVQRLEGRLAVLHQQLAYYTAHMPDAPTQPLQAPPSEVAAPTDPAQEHQEQAEPATLAPPETLDSTEIDISASSAPIDTEAEEAEEAAALAAEEPPAPIEETIAPEIPLSLEEEDQEDEEDEEDEDEEGEAGALEDELDEEEEEVELAVPTAEAAEEPLNRPIAILAPTEALAYAREARAVAQAAEEAARLASARAAEVALRLEQMRGGRHLLQEFALLEAEAERTSAVAQETLYVAEVAEQQVKQLNGTALAQLQRETTLPEDEEGEDELEDDEEEKDSEEGNAPPILLADFEEPPPLLIAEYEKDALTTPDVYPPAEHSKASEAFEPLFSLREIEEEEEMVEAVTSMLIADAAAAAAAKAEALAEASSARVREARRLSQQADRVLQQIWAAIEQGTLTDGEAEQALQAAEREATYAHAALADAEAAEERAVRNAMDAEAEAEVAEGMAIAVDEQSKDKEQNRFYRPFADAGSNDLYNFLDEDDTTELPAIRPIDPGSQREHSSC